jgi:2-dehydro-3-deoxygluconokinase
MKKVVTFGELLLRLSPPNSLKFPQAKAFEANYGGGEFNVAVSLVNYGIPTNFVTRLPENYLGNCARMEVKKMGVGFENILQGGDRLGVYFLENGAGVRASNVIYDRANSAISSIQPGMIDWKKIFQDAQWFHWSGVTAAISQSAAAVCLEAVIAAHEMGIPISCDLNYRSKLWKYGKEPKDIMPELLKYSTVILGDLDTAFFMLGDPKRDPDYQQIDTLTVLYDLIFKKCPSLKYMGTTIRNSVNASHQKIGGVLYDGKKIYATALKDVNAVVDRVGSGDAFMGGLIYGLLKKDNQEALDFAVAACCLKHTIFGDYNLASLDEVEKLASGDSSGKVVR